MDEIVEKLRADYDAVIYDVWEHYHAHPDRMAVIGALKGLGVPPVNGSRVLEIACARGGNLFPMAEQMPGSHFVGIDLSPRQIEQGLELVREAGLTNVELRCQDLMDFPENAGTFDFIIAHGFYSWVPEPVRVQLMKVCKRHLAKNGLAYISYNTYPGWRPKGVIRDMMLYHARGATDPAERVKRGREMVNFVAEHTLLKNSYREMVGEFQKTIAEDGDSYLLHDHMEAVNDAFYLRDFARQAESYGLAYLGDANPIEDAWSRIPGPLREMILKMSANEMERDQYVDFLLNRTFRRSVLCHAEAAAAAQGTTVNHIRKLYVAGFPEETRSDVNAEGKSVIQFGTEREKVQFSDPRPIAALRHIQRAWPSAVSFAELAAEALTHSPAGHRDSEKNAVALAHVIDTCHSLGVVELWTHPTDHISRAAGTHPKATRWARWQAVHFPTVTSLRNSQVKVDDVVRHVLPLLDGSRDSQALAEELVRRNVAAGETKVEGVTAIRDVQTARILMDRALPMFASLSLLAGK